MRISPSMFQAWSVCPCFQYTQSDDGGAAEDGTRIHEAVASGSDDRLNPDQRAQVQKLREYLMALRATLSPGYVELIEHPIVVLDTIKGTLDRALIDPVTMTAHLLDWKAGRLGLPTEAVNSYQLKGYLLGLVRWALATYDKPQPDYRNTLGRLKSVTVHFVAPRTEEVETHEYTEADYPAIEQELRELVARVEDPFKKPDNREPDLCAKCAHQSRCPAACRAIEVWVPNVSMEPIQGITSPVAQMTPETIARFKTAQGAIEAWFEQRNKEVTERVFTEGLEIPGFVKVSRPGETKIDLVKEAISALATVMPLEAVHGCCNLRMKELRAAAPVDVNLDEVLLPFTRVGKDVRYLMRSRKKKTVEHP